MSQSLVITRPDDFHVHLRDGEIMKSVVPLTAAQFSRALIMPNLDPPVMTVAQALEYRNSIIEALPPGNRFNPLMSLYLTDNTSPDEVRRASASEHILGFKLYPAGATTNSSSGVTRISKIMPIFESMAQENVVLQIHGEVTDSNVDVFHREAVFIDQILIPLHHELPELKMVLEHVTTSQGVDFVKQTNHNVAATITPQHVLFNRSEIFRGGIRPHLYCLPILKSEPHRAAVLEAATSGDPSFFLGTDSAPHTQKSKESHCGCAGIFSAYSAIEFFAEAFEATECLHKLDEFAGKFGAQFYGLETNSDKIILEKIDKPVPDRIRAGDDWIVPLGAGQTLSWNCVIPNSA